MLKGVHHQIVEIRQTDNPFFERALLFVRAGCAEQSATVLREAGKQFVRSAKPYTGLRKSRGVRRLRYVLCVIGGALAGAFCGVVCVKIG